MKKNTNLFFDLQKFNNNGYEIHYLLSKYNDFLRVFELKNKFRHLTMKDKKKPKYFQTNFKLPY